MLINYRSFHSLRHFIIFMSVNPKEEELKESDESLALQPAPKKDPKCIVCGAKAEHCMRGLPKNTYCKECAEAYFGMLECLDALGSN